MIERKWFESTEILKKHINYDIFQIYVWLETKDNKFIIVSKDGKKWQLPGGKPESKEEFVHTIQREILEETSLSIGSNELDNSYLFGYYLIIENGKKYLQLRFYLKLNEQSSELSLSPNEIVGETNPIKFVKLVNKDELFTKITWLKNSSEYESLINFKEKFYKLTEILNEKLNKQLFEWNTNKSKPFIEINYNTIRKTIRFFLLKKYYAGLIELKQLQNIIHYIMGCNDYKKIADDILICCFGISYYTFDQNIKYQKFIDFIICYRLIYNNFNNILEYLDFIKKDGFERQIIIGIISPSTTYFFRDQIDNEINEIVKNIKKDNLKILFIGCSTGAEVYSITYCLQKKDINHNITATDINNYAINYAKKGVYKKNIIKSIDKNKRDELFYGNSINSKFKRNINFVTLNIQNNFYIDNFDIIFIRNVIKYFDEKQRYEIFQNIKNNLNTGGIIILGNQYGSNKDVNPKDYIKCKKIGNYSYKI